MKKMIVCLFLTSLSALASEYHYFCTTKESMEDVTLTLDPQKLHVVGGDLNFTAKFDPNYKPRDKSEKVRYAGVQDGSQSRAVILVKELLKGGAPLRNGGHGGYIQIRGDEDSYWSANFFCVQK
jgi:hypothetical protein